MILPDVAEALSELSSLSRVVKRLSKSVGPVDDLELRLLLAASKRVQGRLRAFDQALRDPAKPA